MVILLERSFGMNHTYLEREITEPVTLCDEKGQLKPDSIGWSRKPLISGNVSGHFLRKKKWNYWCITNKDVLFSVTISHLDYAMVCFVYYLDLHTKTFYEKTALFPFKNNKILPDDVLASTRLSSKQMNIDFLWSHNHFQLNVEIPNFDGKPLQANLEISYPETDSLSVVIPWSNQTFQLTTKMHCLPTKGTLSIGSKIYQFSPDESYASLDYGRGVWPRNCTWNWGMASGKQGNDVIGLNFGGQWTDGTGLNENAILINGRLTKISEDMKFHYNRQDFMQPWKIHSLATDCVRLTFTPLFERIAKTDALIVKSEVHQMVGFYDGEIRLQDNTLLTIQQMPGCIEEHIAKW